MTKTDSPVVTVTPIEVPAAVDSANAGRFLEMVRLANAVCLADAGHDYLHEEPEEMLGFFQDQSDWEQLAFLAESDGSTLGAAKLMISKQPDTTTLEFDLMVDPARWGEGAEEALLSAVESVAAARGLRTIQTWTLHRPGAAGRRLEPTTGWGSIPADDRQTRFHLESGFTLEQVERNSVFDLTGDLSLVERMLAQSVEAAGDDYRVVSWTAPTPERYKAGFAEVLARMSTDAPAGGMVVEEQRWDAERVDRRDARQRTQGLTVSVAAVEHVPTGTLAAYNELVVSEDHTLATQQYGTLVLKEHRGHRLGTIVKCANLLRWHELVPESPHVSTFNAEENRHMLDINEAIGFVPASYAGAWKKVLG